MYRIQLTDYREELWHSGHWFIKIIDEPPEDRLVSVETRPTFNPMTEREKEHEWTEQNPALLLQM